MTRDDLKWLFGLVAGVVFALAGHLNLFPWLPLAAQHYIELAGFIVGIGSALLKRSPLAPFDGVGDDRVSGSALESIHKVGPVLLLIAVMGASGCARPVTIVTPQGKAAYTADQIVQRLGELSAVVQADTGTEPGNIRPYDAFTIIAWISGDARATPPTTGLVQTIQTATNDDWKIAARQAYDSYVRGAMMRYPKLVPYLQILDAILGVI